MIPLPASEVARIARVVSALGFERIYGAFWHGDVRADAAHAVQASAERYVAWLQADGVNPCD